MTEYVAIFDFMSRIVYDDCTRGVALERAKYEGKVYGHHRMLFGRLTPKGIQNEHLYTRKFPNGKKWVKEY